MLNERVQYRDARFRQLNIRHTSIVPLSPTGVNSAAAWTVRAVGALHPRRRLWVGSVVRVDGDANVHFSLSAFVNSTDSSRRRYRVHIRYGRTGRVGRIP